jgi:molybdenum cofactor cytidylyltransferase
MGKQRTIAALILAAGSSSRMQREQDHYHKLLLPLGQGTVLSHVLAAALASQAQPIVLVLGHQSTQVRASITPYLDTQAHRDIIITENAAYAQGMSTSLHTGIKVLLNQDHQQQDDLPMQDTSPFPTCDGVLVLLGDQPLITSGLLNQLIEKRYATGKRIIAPLYNGKRGNPVLFAATLFPELLTVTGDEGGRSVIEKHRTEVETLTIDNSQPWYDVDTWEAYQQVLHTWQHQQK